MKEWQNQLLRRLRLIFKLFIACFLYPAVRRQTFTAMHHFRSYQISELSVFPASIIFNIGECFK